MMAGIREEKNWAMSESKRFFAIDEKHKTYLIVQGVFFLHWYLPKKLKYGKPRLGESTLT